MRLLTWCVALLFALATSASLLEAQQAGGEGSAPDNWSKTVEALATALNDNDAGELVAVLSEDVSITTFDSKNADGARLLAKTKKGQVLSSLKYVFAPEKMANDIADAFKSAEVPEELKRKMDIRDEAHSRRANRTAVTWLTESLGAKDGDKVGVLIYWCDKTANEDPEVIFILIKADKESQNARIKTICFGNPILRNLK